jgi:hypothetical protein
MAIDYPVNIGTVSDIEINTAIKPCPGDIRINTPPHKTWGAAKAHLPPDGIVCPCCAFRSKQKIA